MPKKATKLLRLSISRTSLLELLKTNISDRKFVLIAVFSSSPVAIIDISKEKRL